MTAPPPPQAEPGNLTLQRLTDEREVLSFLGGRSIPSAYLTTLIHDNGLVSPANRGTFYGCRDASGRLEGVALLGHATLFDGRTDGALQSFAKLAQADGRARVIMDEQGRVERFLSFYAESGRSPRLVRRELLLEQRSLVEVREPVPGLRRASVSDLDLVAPVHAAMAFAESGVNPLERDPEGFLRRTARRLEQGRVWVWVEGGRLIFKADVIADTPAMTYLEGIYVTPEERGKGYGRRCVSQLGRGLLRRSASVCLLVREENTASREFFRRADFRLRGYYDTAYLD
jgi:hypothetical protein